MVACWSCGAQRAPSDALCPACGKVQPPPPRRVGEPLVVDKFAILGVPRTFELELASLEAVFRSQSRKLHPDRFARASAQERRYALEQTTLLNDAFRSLKDPARRAEHFLELLGIHLAGEQPKHAHELPVVKVLMSPEFLEEMMDERERLLEAKLEGGPEAVAAHVLATTRKRVATLVQVGLLLGEISQCVDQESQRQKAMEAAEQVARLRYYARSLDEAEGRPAEG